MYLVKFLHCLHDEQSDRVTHWLTNRGGTRRVCFCPCCSSFEPQPLNWDQPGRSTEPPTPSEDGPYYAGGPPYTPDGEERCKNKFGDVLNSESDVRTERKVHSLTSIMWPVEMSMLDWAGSSLQDGVELWVEDGLCWGPSLNWEETLLTRDVSVPLRPPAPVGMADPAMLPPATQSWRHREDLDAMCCRHNSWVKSKEREM